MPIQTNRSVGKSQGDKNYRYYEHAGVPFAGKPELMYMDEYDNRVTRVGKSGFGLFDVSKPDQEKCGRTMQQVLDRAYVGEYELIVMQEYNNGVGEDPRQPPSLFAYLVWIEKLDTTPQNAKQLAQQNG